MAEEARAAALEIAADIERRVVNPESGGHDPAAAALLFAYLATVDQDQRWVDLAEHCHHEALGLHLQRRAGFGLFGGLTGIAWIDDHVAELVFEPDADDSESDVDAALAVLLTSRPWRGQYDLISGLVGFGVYALERPDRPSARNCFRLVLDCLDETAERRDGFVTWHTPCELLGRPDIREQFPHGWYNLGIAHGVPGVVALLALAINAGCDDSRIQPMLDGAVRWLVAQRLPPGARSAFATYASADQVSTGSRCAWCYGDPGVAMSLLLASQARGTPELKELAIQIAEKSLALPFESTLVKDAGLCHGASGLLQICLRIYQMTGISEFQVLSRLWLSRTIAMRKPGEGIGGFSTWGIRATPDAARFGEEFEWQSDPSFLTGAVGIALTLLGATSNCDPRWDRLLVLS